MWLNQFWNLGSRKKAKGIRSTSSMALRRIYQEAFERELTNPPFSEIKEAYLVAYCPSNENVLFDIIKYIEKKQFRKIRKYEKDVLEYRGSFGEEIGEDLYEIILLLDKQDRYFFIVLKIEFQAQFHISLKKIIAIDSINPDIFPERILVFPV